MTEKTYKVYDFHNFVDRINLKRTRPQKTMHIKFSKKSFVFFRVDFDSHEINLKTSAFCLNFTFHANEILCAIYMIFFSYIFG